jgi:hypothetical protein
MGAPATRPPGGLLTLSCTRVPGAGRPATASARRSDGQDATRGPLSSAGWLRVPLEELANRGQVRRTGEGRATRWHLIADGDRIEARAAEIDPQMNAPSAARASRTRLRTPCGAPGRCLRRTIFRLWRSLPRWAPPIRIGARRAEGVCSQSLPSSPCEQRLPRVPVRPDRALRRNPLNPSQVIAGTTPGARFER